MKSKRPLAIDVSMPDGSVWRVPADVIALNRADHYKDEFNGDINLSLAEDTWPLFEDSEFEIIDWAGNNMNWSDVESVAKPMPRPEPAGCEKGWVNGKKKVLYAEDV